MISFRGRKFLIYSVIILVALIVVIVSFIQSYSFPNGIIIKEEIIHTELDDITGILYSDSPQLPSLNDSISTLSSKAAEPIRSGTEIFTAPPLKQTLPDPSELGVFELCGGAERDYEASTTIGNETVVRIVHMSWKSTTLHPRFTFYQKSWCDCFPRWRHFLWTDADNERLVKVHYSWFYERYQSFDKNIFRIDSVRYLYLHRYGGMYTDLDNVCLRPFEKLLLGGPPLSFGDMDGSRSAEGWMYIQNSWMYSRAGHAFWEDVMKHIKQADARGRPEPVTGPYQLMGVLRRGWKTRGYANASRVFEARLFNPFSWISSDRAVCKDYNKMDDAQMRRCIAHFNATGAYVLQLHTQTWLAGKIM